MSDAVARATGAWPGWVKLDGFAGERGRTSGSSLADVERIHEELEKRNLRVMKSHGDCDQHE